METWYRFSNWGTFATPEIKEIQVERETEKSIWVRGQRSLKISTYEKNFRTYEEASDYIRKQMKRRYDIAKSQLERAAHNLEAANQL